MLWEWVMTIDEFPKGLQRFFVLPPFPTEEHCWFAHTYLCFNPLLLSRLSCQLRNDKKPFFKKCGNSRVLQDRWSCSGSGPLRGLLFSEQNHLCLPGRFYTLLCLLYVEEEIIGKHTITGVAVVQLCPESRHSASAIVTSVVI